MFARPQRPFTTLFVALLVATIVRPALATTSVGHWAFALVMVFVFGSAIWILCQSRRQWWLAITFGACWILTRLPTFLRADPGLAIEVAGRLAEIAFLTLTVSLLVRAIFQKRTASLDNILGAFAGYLMIAMIWGVAFSIVVLFDPGALRTDAALQPEWMSPEKRDWVLTYFSCCTLMTVGYGDITPVHPAARTLAVLEAMTGQIYLAVLVAVLVGMKVAHGLFSPPSHNGKK
jgi:Ion channel